MCFCLQQDFEERTQGDPLILISDTGGVSGLGLLEVEQKEERVRLILKMGGSKFPL